MKVYSNININKILNCKNIDDYVGELVLSDEIISSLNEYSVFDVTLSSDVVIPIHVYNDIPSLELDINDGPIVILGNTITVRGTAW